MINKKALFLFIVICGILTSCNAQSNLTQITPNTTPTLVSPTQAQPTEIYSTPTLTPFPIYSTKRVIFNYYIVAGLSDFDMLFDPNDAYNYSKIVMYDDGQMIIVGDTYKQKVLPQIEIKQFFSKLDSLGFFTLESNRMDDPTDKLYNFGNTYHPVTDGEYYCVFVDYENSKKLCVYEPDMQFVIPKMKNILKYLDNYQPTGATPYYPDRIFLDVLPFDVTSDNPLPDNTTEWDKHLPPLTNSIMYFEGDMAKEIYLHFNKANVDQVFTQDGDSYRVFMRIILPHEVITNEYQ